MLVCHCFQITDREIAREAARGARSPEDLSMSCPAGQGCGGCSSLVERILQGVPTTACARRTATTPTETSVSTESVNEQPRRNVRISSSRIAVRASERRNSERRNRA
ncbi:MAG: (2Fe-2S)-binding protein [Planctomycetota bacterium]